MGIISQLYDVAGWLGPAGVGAALAFIAYLIGVLTERVGESFPTLSNDLRDELQPTTVTNLDELIERTVTDARSRNVPSGWVLRPFPLLKAEERAHWTSEAQRELQAEASDIAAFEDITVNEYMQEGFWQWTSERLLPLLRQRVIDEVDLAEVSLQAANKDLYDKYDRLDAEASFRGRIGMPLVAVGAALTYRTYEFFGIGALLIELFAFIGAVVLTQSAAKTKMAAMEVMFQSIIAGVTQSPTLKLVADMPGVDEKPK
ncbi:hypothetical protein [Herbiconiux solani]|uniref:hypothetical protein n=1 Tax=Herbiconiux solani TaxID=661329 RepID=UPI000826A913|nr:hypothetical protein [Herbiconiux solani]